MGWRGGGQEKNGPFREGCHANLGVFRTYLISLTNT